MTDRDTAERAAYQRAVELAKDEIARLQSDVFALRAALEQQQRATDAERAARRSTEADLGWWHATVANYVTSATVRDREILRDTLAEATTYPHPGAALLAELDAARAVVAMVRWAVEQHYAPPPLCDALETYEKAMKGSAG